MEQHEQHPKIKSIPYKRHSYRYLTDNNYVKKYLPKYCDSMEQVKESNWSTFENIKKMKYLAYGSTWNFSEKDERFLRLVKNKLKSIQSFSDVPSSLTKYISNIKKVELYFEEKRFLEGFWKYQAIEHLSLHPKSTEGFFSEQEPLNLENLEDFKKGFKYLTTMKKLRTLTIYNQSELTEKFYLLLEHYESSPHFLSRLEKFEIVLNWYCVSLYSDYKEWVFPNVFENLTEFCAEEYEFCCLCAPFWNIKEYQNLKTLKLSLGQGFVNCDQHQDFSILHDIMEHNKLRSFSLVFNASKGLLSNFLKNFAVGKSLVELDLHIRDIDWNSAMPEGESIDLDSNYALESSPLFYNFFEKWRGLDQLQTLSLNFELDFSASSGFYILLSILKRLRAIKRLNYLGVYPYNHKGTKRKFEFDHFWEVIDHLKPSLTDLTIDAFVIDISGLWIQASDVPQLRSLRLDGIILGDNNFGKLFKLCTPVSSKIHFVKLDSLVVQNNESLKRILDILLDLTPNLEVECVLDVKCIPAKEVLKSLVDFTKVGRDLHNLSLTVGSLRTIKKEDVGELTSVLLEKRTQFKLFHIWNFQSRRILYLLENRILELDMESLNEECPEEPLVTYEKFCEDLQLI